MSPIKSTRPREASASTGQDEVYYFTWTENDGIGSGQTDDAEGQDGLGREQYSENWVDTSYLDRPGARKSHPYFLSLGLRSARKAERPGALTQLRMKSMAKRLRKLAPGRLCHWVGESRFGGQIRQYYYGEDQAAVKLMIAAAKSNWLHNQVEVFLDVDWSLYFDRVVPTAAQRQGMENKRIFARYKAKGDQVHIARRINHYLAFHTENDRDRFLSSARQAGFALGEPFLAEESEMPYGVYVHRRGYLDLAQITQDSTALIDCAEPVEGIYLYWDCQLVRK